MLRGADCGRAEIIAAFTIAHSITLALAALTWWCCPTYGESVIALHCLRCV
jgi:hypothetical protein